MLANFLYDDGSDFEERLGLIVIKFCKCFSNIMVQILKSTRVTLVEEGGSLEAILGNYRSLKKHKEYTTLVTQERKNVKTNEGENGENNIVYIFRYKIPIEEFGEITVRRFRI